MTGACDKEPIVTPATAVAAAHADPDSLRGQIIQVISEQMKSCRSVLELGAGHFEIIGALKCPVRVGVEIHAPYLERRICDPLVVPILADATRAAELFPQNSFDGVMMIDFIEHLEKDTAVIDLPLPNIQDL
ncbi:MAG: hypothetical protein ACE5GA_10090, partial [Candidatus Zixiibacteriota bacterium]